MINQTRHTLIQKLKNQYDDSAWETFIETYQNYIIMVLVKTGVTQADINDLKQAVLLKIWKKMPEFEFEPNKGSFRSWLWKVMQNTVYNHFSSRKNEAERIKKYFELKDGSAKPELIELISNEWKDFLTDKAMQNLKGKFADRNIEIFEVFLKTGDRNAIAEKYDLKLNTATRIINRVKERLIIEIANLRRELE